MTVANLFCGYACVVYSTRGDFDTAAVLIGIAMVARHARRLLRAPDELARRRSASSSTRWPTSCRSASRRRSWRSRGACGRSDGSGWAAGLHLRHRRRDAAGALQHPDAAATDKRYFAGLPSPAAGGVDRVDGLPVSVGTAGSARRGARRWRWCSCPAFLMVSTIRFRSIKAIDVGWRRSLRRAVPRRRRARAHRVAPAAGAGRAGVHLRRLVGRRLRASRLRRGSPRRRCRLQTATPDVPRRHSQPQRLTSGYGCASPPAA